MKILDGDCVCDVSTGFIGTEGTGGNKKVFYDPLVCAEHYYKVLSGMDCVRAAGRYIYNPYFGLQMKYPEDECKGYNVHFKINCKSKETLDESMEKILKDYGDFLTDEDREKIYTLWENTELKYG